MEWYGSKGLAWFMITSSVSVKGWCIRVNNFLKGTYLIFLWSSLGYFATLSLAWHIVSLCKLLITIKLVFFNFC